MKERPILFSGPMVRAILEGRKTVTRRIAKPVKHPDLGNIYAPGALVLEHEPQHVVDRACPYGQPGDRLWVRETWTDVNMCGAPALAYRADEDIRDLMEEPGFLDDRGAFNYDDPRVKPYPFACWYAELDQARWRPSIHMPRWASRILLEITSVRVERLQDISEEQAIAEGPPGLAFPAPPGSHWVTEDGRRRAFMRLWDDVNGAGAWDANPWVWVVEFKRVTP
ncbi:MULTISPECIES: hypothetical protein [Pseudomonas]|uniref:Morphogenetic protein n=1 Tax=Pseudomonas phage Epa33 TaxID=2719194 RepID=A0A6G9LM45_9CAUD|nr:MULTISPECIES: hypothetical protein [Pseudomonas]YP_010765962.1 hypothetical protein QGM59_gp08 [Pseudomonas phage Epa33]EIU6857780.1 hypothetical protein [Pseudomonas aeruginosa]EIU6984356.1 hypothetical protein [Pseudomonas aeruginosa]EJM8831987.1 hypothetical protein [Pseudomonas aeruginosa]EKT8668918.1 hypothetical protein [Pseudomonas aeruginosa]EKX2116685.1 hypothetical protein [Pseudomonas aeruginosa]